ncbi:hypothetical protein V1477_018029 [Vespula maculifrons]|uniref:Uncharacterized protein n=1 Tax=Vespula maculifrons TaxID=7453 RepID=A0ABD2B1D6_VESMC
MVNVVTNSDKITTTTEKRNVFGSSKISEGITIVQKIRDAITVSVADAVTVHPGSIGSISALLFL